VVVFRIAAAAQVRLTPRIYDGLAFSHGQPMNVRVPVVGHPIPSVTWLKDGEELLTEAGRREVWLEDGCAVLNISECRRPDDRGVYGIRVENSFGIDEATFPVEITGNICNNYNDDDGDNNNNNNNNNNNIGAHIFAVLFSIPNSPTIPFISSAGR